MAKRRRGSTPATRKPARKAGPRVVCPIQHHRLVVVEALSLANADEIAQMKERLEAGNIRFDSLDAKAEATSVKVDVVDAKLGKLRQSTDEQLIELRRELHGLPTLLRQIDAEQTTDIKEHFDNKVGTIAAQQEGLATRLRTLEEARDARDGLVSPVAHS